MKEYYKCDQAMIYKVDGVLTERKSKEIDKKTGKALHEYRDCIIEGVFLGKTKPKVGDSFNWPAHKLVNIEVKEIILVRDAVKPHYPIVVDGIEYPKEHFQKDRVNVDHDFTNAFMKLRLG